MRRCRWNDVDSAIKKVNDPVAKDVLRWVRAANDRNAPIDLLSYVHLTLNDWPRLTRVRANAEKKMFEQDWDSSRVFDWFVGQPEPISGEGRGALARAYYARGDTPNGDRYLRLAWRESRLTRDGQKKLFKLYRDKLTKEDNAARADHLIWSGSRHFDKARALLPHMGKADRAVMNARMKLNRNSSGITTAVNAIPKDSLDNPGFLYERARWRRRKKSKSYAMPIYLSARSAPVSELGRKEMWREKKIMAYWAISEGNLKEAHQLSLHHGFSRGTEFADAEFLAGWTALIGLREPDRALKLTRWCWLADFSSPCKLLDGPRSCRKTRWSAGPILSNSCAISQHLLWHIGWARN